MFAYKCKIPAKSGVPTSFHAYKRQSSKSGTLTLNRDAKHLTTESMAALLTKSNVLGNAIAGVGSFVGGVKSQNNIFFRNTHVLQFLSDINICGVLLEPDLAVFDVEVKDGVINAVQAFPADAHKLIVVADGIEKEFVFDFFLGFGLAVLL